MKEVRVKVPGDHGRLDVIIWDVINTLDASDTVLNRRAAKELRELCELNEWSPPTHWGPVPEGLR